MCREKPNCAVCLKRGFVCRRAEIGHISHGLSQQACVSIPFARVCKQNELHAESELQYAAYLETHSLQEYVKYFLRNKLLNTRHKMTEIRNDLLLLLN
jgi:hypothetical protein